MFIKLSSENLVGVSWEKLYKEFCGEICMTEILKVDPLKVDKDLILKAGNYLKLGDVVAFPTETVYGLGALFDNSKGVRRIFEAKGRPNDNPLIVHVSSVRQVEDLVLEISSLVKKVMEKFWPGPLTVILNRSSKVPLDVTAGLETVAIRMPAHGVALALIDSVGPIAAPSANISGRPSGVTGEHVFEDFSGSIPLVIDAGQTQIGLESTVVDFTSSVPTVLRSGAVTVENLLDVLPEVEIGGKVVKSPGMKHKHYSPRVPVIISSEVEKDVKRLREEGNKTGFIGLRDVSCEKKFVVGSLEDFARNLFLKMREFEKCVDLIVVEAVDETGLGRALMDRVRRAASD